MKYTTIEKRALDKLTSDERTKYLAWAEENKPVDHYAAIKAGDWRTFQAAPAGWPWGDHYPEASKTDLPTVSIDGTNQRFVEEIAAAAQRHYQIIMANRERYLAAWIAETGLRPSESCLVEQRHADGSVTITVKRREGC